MSSPTPDSAAASAARAPTWRFALAWLRLALASIVTLQSYKRPESRTTLFRYTL